MSSSTGNPEIAGVDVAALAKNRIGGKVVAGEGALQRVIHNPANIKDIVAEVREASLAQVEAATVAAAEAAAGWRAVPATDRIRVV